MSAIPPKNLSYFIGVFSGISKGDKEIYPEKRREDTAKSDCIAMVFTIRVNFFNDNVL